MDSATQVLHGPRLLSRGGLLGCNPRRPLHLCLPQPLLHLSRVRPLARQIRLRRRPRRPLLLKLRRQFSPPLARRLRLLLGGPCRLLGRPRLCLRRLQPPSVRILLHLDVAKLCVHRRKHHRRRRGERRLTRPAFGHPRGEGSLAPQARPLPLGRTHLRRHRALERRRRGAQRLRRRSAQRLRRQLQPKLDTPCQLALFHRADFDLVVELDRFPPVWLEHGPIKPRSVL
mmetsp:Transcript_39812/g.128012  ORF Transcript_39812/g.128012 Transcript_39812/m.128012 type:complete len:229 (-) Transcript_39812:265-951(-)